MSLIKQSLIFVMFNVIILIVLGLADSTTTSFSTSDVDYDASGLDYSDIANIDDKYMVTQSVLDSANIPAWFSSTFLLIDGLWFVFIFAGWVRGSY